MHCGGGVASHLIVLIDLLVDLYRVECDLYILPVTH